MDGSKALRGLVLNLERERNGAAEVFFKNIKGNLLCLSVKDDLGSFEIVNALAIGTSSGIDSGGCWDRTTTF